MCNLGFITLNVAARLALEYSEKLRHFNKAELNSTKQHFASLEPLCLKFSEQIIVRLQVFLTISWAASHYIAILCTVYTRV